MTRLKNAKAFTLIELIVVIVIIGILVAIAAVAYNSIIANSKKSSLKASAAQVAKIVQAHSAATQTVQNDAMVTTLKTANTFTGDGVKAAVKIDAATATPVTTDFVVIDDANGDGLITAGENYIKVTYSSVAGGALTVDPAGPTTAAANIA